MITRVGVRKIGLCTTIAVFGLLLVIGITWGGRGPGPGGGGGAEKHNSPTGECTVCHPGNLKDIHLGNCQTCHASGGGGGPLKVDYTGATAACRDCHNVSGEPEDYHEEMDTRHAEVESFFLTLCEKCHDTSKSLTAIHEGVEVTDCPSAVSDIEDDIFCYCLACHLNPDFPEPGTVLEWTCSTDPCHETAEYYNPYETLPEEDQCPHKFVDVESHDECLSCHLECPESE